MQSRIQDDFRKNSLLTYEAWHQSAIHACDSWLPTPHRLALRNRLCSLYTSIRNIVIEASRSHTEEGVPPTETIPLSQCRLIEDEIADGICKHDLLSPLSFLEDLSILRDRSTPQSYLDGKKQTRLDPNDHNSRTTLNHLQWIDDVLSEIAKPTVYTGLFPSQLADIEAGMLAHRSCVLAHIEAQRLLKLHPSALVQTVSSKIYRPILLYSPEIVHMGIIAVSLRYNYRLPRRSTRDFLACLRRYFLLNVKAPLAFSKMHKDPRTYERMLGLKMPHELLSICSRCGASYPVGGHGLPTTQICTNKPKNQSRPCGQSLCHMHQNRRVPALLFRRRKLDQWVGSLLRTEGNLEKLNSAWEASRRQPTDVVTSFWSGTFIRNMKGPDRTTSISSFPHEETRLLLSLAIDWFNPYHNRISGKAASTGSIFMACLNLPLEERFKEENIHFVGIMPGRQQQQYLDGILQPLVDELKQYWDHGVYFVGIPGLNRPQLVRIALVQLVCDLPAARKVAGFPGHSASHNCSVCVVHKRNVPDITSTSNDSPLRTSESHIRHALAYKEALDRDGRAVAEKLLKKDAQAVRWSALNELPYWKPVECTVIDAMHLILLGLCSFHWRSFWGGDRMSGPKRGQSNNTGDIPRRSSYSHNLTATHEADDGRIQPDPTFVPENAVVDNSEDSGWDTDVSLGTSPLKCEFISAKSMNAARRLWIMKDPNTFTKATIKQILALLQENSSELPAAFSKKEELSALLRMCRQSYRHLPYDTDRDNGNRSPLGDRIRQAAASGIRLSKSEELYGDESPVQLPHIGPRPKSSFITRSELEEIQMDIKEIVVPSWFTKPSPRFGDKGNGRVKAAEWKNISSVYLPMTFLRLWALELTRGSSKEVVLHLKALLSLAIVVHISTAPSFSKAGVQLYQDAIQFYLQIMKQLHPESSLVINHHLSLHLPFFMGLHGPCREYWAFPFERLIGKLQKISHNSSIDDIPKRIFEAFGIKITLNSLSQSYTSVPQSEASKQTPRVEGQRIAVNDTTKRKIEEVCGTSPEWIVCLDSFTIGDVVYRPHRPNLSLSGDSLIGFISSEGAKYYCVGQIERILRVPATRLDSQPAVVFIVKCFKAAPTCLLTHLWKGVLAHPCLGIYLSSTDFKEESTVLLPSMVVGHVAVRVLQLRRRCGLLTLQLSKNFEARRRIKLPY
ncbi:hypothetical protein FRC16_002711 [Serendipita sp. 398]|nr:hypothetical protein FRC16_002711 [Serendipita sp. 398]